MGIPVEENRVVDGKKKGEILYAGWSGYKNDIRDAPH